MNILAIIPARGGSRVAPRKNIRNLAGQPLIAHAIKAAQDSRLITRVIVSTDDAEIAEVAKKYGAEVPFMRPKELAENDTPDLPVFQHALRWLAAHENYQPDLVVHLRPTSPLRGNGVVDRAIEKMMDHPKADAVRTVSYAGRPPLKMWRLEHDLLVPYIPEEVYGLKDAYNMPRQKLPKHYVQNGVVDVVKPEVILGKNSMTGDVIVGLETPEETVTTIDAPVDFQLVELLLKDHPELLP